MASWGDVETYNNMISDLGTFCKDVKTSCGVMLSAANTCVQMMEKDKASLEASKKVALSIKQYEEATVLAEKLAKALEEERNDMIAYLRSIEDLED